MTEEDGPRTVTRYSVRPPSRFVGKGADFRLWIQRVELYFREADIPRDKRGQELASLLDDEPFRIVSQMGLLRVDSGIDYAAVKECLEKQFAPSQTSVGVATQISHGTARAGRVADSIFGEAAYARGQGVSIMAGGRAPGTSS